MPRGDRTGPDGLGPMTGRRAGFCGGYPVPGYMNNISGRGYGGWFGRGFGRGLGFGRGRAWRSWFGAAVLPDWVNPEDTEYPPAAMRPEDEKKMLAAQVSELEKQLEAVNQRLSELEEK